MKEILPPHRITRFLEWFCPNDLAEGIICDLEEQFFEDIDEIGLRKARRRYFFNSIRFIRPGILFRRNSKFNLIHSTMFTNYLKTAGRNYGKNKLLSFINGFGLSIGIAFCILIYLYILDEKSFDQFHVNKKNIFRIEEKAYSMYNPDPDKPYSYSAYLQTGLAPTMKEEIPQVKYATRFNSGAIGTVTHNGKPFTDKLSYVDPDFFQMFTFRIIEGNKSNFFTDRYDIIITPTVAKKFFGNEDPIGKVLTIKDRNEGEYTVRGIIEDCPKNSSLQYNILLSQENRPGYEHNVGEWGNFSTPTFVQLHDNADTVAFGKNLMSLVDKYMSDDLKRWADNYNLKLDDETALFEYQYSNLQDIHLNTQIHWEKSSDPQYGLILGGIALLILCIACINYISLSMTTSASRKVEVGIRKVIGAHRRQLISQFIIESTLLVFISTVVGICLMSVFLPLFNEFTQKSIELTMPLLMKVVGVGLMLSLFIGLFSGSYPAFFVSSFKPVKALKTGFTSKLKAGFTRPLVILQFGLSSFLIISSIIMYKQMDFITSKDLGFEKDHILVININSSSQKEEQRVASQVRNRLSMEPDVLKVAATNASFTKGYWKNGFKVDDVQKWAYIYNIDPYYLETLDINLKLGRNFDERSPSDSNAVIVNEAMVKEMGWDKPLESYLNWREDSLVPGHKIIGVVEDFHFLSLSTPIEPMFFTINEGSYRQILVKLQSDKIHESIAKINQIWSELYPEKPFTYSFLDEDIARQYDSNRRWMKIMGLSTLFAILISCLGLFGLSGINAMNRTKEIGIRKVFGAKLSTIVLLLNKQFVYLAMLSFLLAMPFSWYVMKEWLTKFEYGIPLTWQIFFISFIFGLVVALITVSYHALKSAFSNPAETLKYE